MTFPRRLARINRYVTNPVARRFAGRIAPFAIVVHQGRRSGRTFRTPVMAFSTESGFAIALTYGRDAEWVRNVLTAASCVLEYRGRPLPLTEPRPVPLAEGAAVLPPVVRPAMRLLGVQEVLTLRAYGDDAGA